MFRNLRFYKINSPWPQSEQDLSEKLAENAFSPCAAYAEKSAGWEPPVAFDDAPLSRRLNGADLLQLRTQSRVLPVAAIKEAMVEKVDEYRGRMAQEPPRSELRRIREETKDELLPKALLRSDRTLACYLISESILAVDAGTDAKADWFVDNLRLCFSEFACVPLDFEEPPAGLLQKIFLGQAPQGLELGSECRMQDVSDAKSLVTWRGFELSDASIRRHVTDGMRLTHLGVVFEEVVNCVIDESGVISKFRFAEGEALDTPDSEDPLERLDADFVLLSGTVLKLLQTLKKELGGYA